MFDKLFAPPESLIIATKEQTVLNARTTVLGSLVFCTLAFLVFFHRRRSEREGVDTRRLRYRRAKN